MTERNGKIKNKVKIHFVYYSL